ncbi:MAG TPA: hypothetical protein PLZ43_16405, partial [bacterium]|nr:hypothetical protein [bacterium]
MKFLIISAMFFFLACNNISSSEKKIHFTDIFGNKLESFESFYEKLFNLFGEYVPDTITVEFKEPGTSQFDTTTSTVLIAVSSLRKEETVAHESCHLALASFTTQISNTEQF